MSSSVAAPATTIYATILNMDPADLAAFRQRLRRRYGRDEIIEQLRLCTARLGQSPTMREFAEDPDVTIHPQTVVEHFGSWNAAKREAGLLPRRMATREELITALQALGAELGHAPTAKEIDAAPALPGKGVYSKEFGSIRKALMAAGFDAPSKDERLVRSVEHGADFLARTGRMPSFRDWERIRGGRADLLTAWQIYRTFEETGGAWSAFQFAVSELATARANAAAATSQVA